MEAEERPAKLQKLEHSNRSSAEVDTDYVPLPAEEPPVPNSNDLESSGVAPTENCDDQSYTETSPTNNPTNTTTASDHPLAEFASFPAASTTTSADPSLLSKSAQKRLRRHEEWESQRSARKANRKAKRAAKQAARRSAKASSSSAAATAADSAANIPSPPFEPASPSPSPTATAARRPRNRANTAAVQVPLAIVLDCGFDDLMTAREISSLAGQLTRCYADNRAAPYRAHLAVAEFGGQLRERFDTALGAAHERWRGVAFDGAGVAEVCERMRAAVAPGADGAGRVAGALAAAGADDGAEAEEATAGETIYLSSDSPDTLTRLRPHSVYVIGGLVDKNRHKGACARKAAALGLRTARLPIAEYLRMASRQVLATNHVAEIALRWLEGGEWGRAFVEVVPKRKGGELREREGDGEGDGCGVDAVDGGKDEGEKGGERTKAEAGGPAAGDEALDGVREVRGEGVKVAQTGAAESLAAAPRM